MTRRPVLYVLAGVNGAGKSSVGGHLFQRAGLAWFNPDTFARDLVAATGCDQTEANAAAWQEGVRRLDAAIAGRRHYAFETTLGGRTVPQRILEATRSHDVMVWFCGLHSPEQHLARVRARVQAGGHDIPEAKIRERWNASRENLIALMPHLARLQVYDNSAEAGAREIIPDPVLVAEMVAGQLVLPQDLAALASTPDWAKPLLEAALSMQPSRSGGGVHG
ncbi:MAG: zeta toxin family protein [Pseudomonadota bacterium]|nr:zeta toxin family protein [Pseudomonadota bacterium]